MIRIIHKFCLTNVLKTNRLSTTKIYFLLNSSVFCIKSYSIQSKRNEYILHNYLDLKHKHVSFINSYCTLKCCHLLTAFYIFEQQVELDKGPYNNYVDKMREGGGLFLSMLRV